MRAAVVRALPARELSLEDLDAPRGAHGWLEVAVEACGICGTDLHILAGESYRPELPFVLGHEPCGVVVGVYGDGDASDLLGRRVVASIFVGCGACPPCLAGNERLCERGARITGVAGLWGGFAERLALAPTQPVAVPAGLGATEAAALVDAGATAYNAARVAAAHGAGRILVLGGGPVGFLTASILRSFGRDCVVVEPNGLRSGLLAARGHSTLASLDGCAAEIDIVIDCAGAPQNLPRSLGLLRAHGLFLAVGYTRVPDVDLAAVSRGELTIRGIRSGRRDDLAQVLELAAKGVIDVPPVTVWPLARVNEALDELWQGRVAGKAVVAVG